MLKRAFKIIQSVIALGEKGMFVIEHFMGNLINMGNLMIQDPELVAKCTNVLTSSEKQLFQIQPISFTLKFIEVIFETQPMVLLKEKYVTPLLNGILVTIMLADKKNQYLLLLLLGNIFDFAFQNYAKIQINSLMLLMNNEILKKMDEEIGEIDAVTTFKGLWIQMSSKIYSLFRKTKALYKDELTSDYEFDL